nr:TMV resistance protein N-like [Ipomoea batatas]
MKKWWGDFPVGVSQMQLSSRRFCKCSFQSEFRKSQNWGWAACESAHVGVLDLRNILLLFTLKEDCERVLATNHVAIEGSVVNFAKWICALVGRLVVVDIVTSRRTRPSAARAKVEVNLLKPLVDRVWIEVEGKEGFWQRFEYDYVPFYYTSFSRIGHKMEVCRKGNAAEGVDMVELGVIGASMEVVTVIKEEPQALQGKLEEEEARLDLWHARFNRKEKRVIVQEAFGLRVRTSAMQRKSWAERIKRSV